METQTALTAKDLQTTLHQALEPIGQLERCALLQYPYSPNIGDSLIWLGSVLYLTEVLKTQIGYCSSSQDFSAQQLDKKVGIAPILLMGGGNLGDIWLEEQRFREHIVEKYRDRPIVSLPQTVLFRDERNIETAAKIFNAHPDLTLFIRDDTSYNLALSYFPNCRIFKAPDLAFHLTQLPELPLKPDRKSSVLYHVRYDLEFKEKWDLESMGIADLVVQDWISFEWCYPWLPKNSHWFWQMPGTALLMRNIWQRFLSTPQEWLSRQRWMSSGSYPQQFRQMHDSWRHLRSWSLLHTGMYQFQQYPFIITDRLHGHILSVLRGIPHIFLPNAYHKNEAFYQAWTSGIPYCRLARDREELTSAVRDLLQHEN
jgi:exopolysaccharide biosynthesis predicted pyruvyltransferase EpsI